jgi:hypothetical protein
MFHPHFFHTGLLSCHTPDVTANAMGLVSTLVLEKEPEDARAREKPEPYTPVDYNKKADGPYKNGSQ